jgi:hypothetical protein
MDMSNNDERDFLEKNFKAGEYASMTVMVKIEDIDEFIETLRNANLTLAIIPSVQASLDFDSTDGMGMTN